MRCGLNRCLHSTQGDTVPASQAVVLAAGALWETLVLRSSCVVTRNCVVEPGVKGSDIMDVKGEVTAFGKRLDMENRHWEVRCFGTDPGTAYLTQWDTLCGLHQLSLPLGDFLILVSHILYSSLGYVLDRYQSAVL